MTPCTPALSFQSSFTSNPSVLQFAASSQKEPSPCTLPRPLDASRHQALWSASTIIPPKAHSAGMIHKFERRHEHMAPDLGDLIPGDEFTGARSLAEKQSAGRYKIGLANQWPHSQDITRSEHSDK